MTSDIKKQQESAPGDVTLSKEDKEYLALFGKPNLILKVGDRSLYVRKELLMEKSPVFKRMFESDFKEATATEISLPGKDPLAVSRFLVYISSWCEKKLDEKTARELLPLAKEYQTDSLMREIDTLLASVVKQGGDTITINTIIQNILEAELYDMHQYLNECIAVASRKMYKKLDGNLRYFEVTNETKLKICKKKMLKIEDVYEFEMKSGYNISYFAISKKDLELYMNAS